MSTSYYVYPSVVKVGQTAKVRIIPRSESTRFDHRFAELSWGEVAPKQRFPEEWFTPDRETVRKVKIVPFCNWYRPENDEDCEEKLIKVDEDGGLTIEFFADYEQEYVLKIRNREDSEWRYVFSVYAVNEDLFGKRAYKGDLHSHSIYSDGCEHYKEIAANYRNAGFDFLSLTDHFKRFPSLMMEKDINVHDFGLTVYPGEEVHVPDIKYHYVHVGGDYSVNEYYIDNKEVYEKEFREIYDSIDVADEKQRDFIARLVWIHRANKKAGGLSIFAHPFWRWTTMNVTYDVTDYIFENGYMDVFELMGGQTIGENNIQLALWQDWGFKGKKYPIVSSSDQHTSYKERADIFNGYYSIVFAKDPSFEEVSKAILNGESVAVEHREEKRRDFRAYGSKRYVAYAQYIWREFYPIYEELCKAVAVFMKLYFEGDEKALDLALEAQKRADTFAERFFGRI